MAAIEFIGTSHIAKQSMNEITKKIHTFRPDIVAVELDPQRLHALMQGERKLELRAIWQLGFFGFIFAKFGSWLQKELGKKVGIMPGSDMKLAVNEARKIKAKIFLIDRPLQLTLHRLSKNMSRWEKTKLVGHILFGGFSPKNRKILKQINLTKVPSDKLIQILMNDIKQKFPALHKVLIEERNNYMAHQIRKISEKLPESKILIVVGAGHVKELKRMLAH